MKFSVLLSVYEKEQVSFLRKSLNSVFNQTLLPDEVILVKDGPLTTELEHVIDDFARKYLMLKVISLPINQGLGKALNEGLRHCSNDIVARMDTDDVAKPYRFEKQIRIFCEHPEIDVVSAWVDEFEGTIFNVLSIRKLPQFHEKIQEYARRRCPVNHPVVMFRKNTVINAGGYQHFFLFEDYYLWVRMLLKGAKFYNIPESLLYFRMSKDMIRRRGGWKYMKSEVKFQKELWELHFINCPEFLCNVLIRFIVRIIPNSLRAIIYLKVLR